MARPKTKSALVEGIKELVGSLRTIESRLGLILNTRNNGSFRLTGRPGRPAGSTNKNKVGRPAGSGRGPGRPPGSLNKKGPGRPAGTKKKGSVGRPSAKRRGRPAGSKNKK